MFPSLIRYTTGLLILIGAQLTWALETIDSDFNPTILARSAKVNDISWNPVSEYFYLATDVKEGAVFKFNEDGSRVEDFSLPHNGLIKFIHCLPDGTIYIAGTFTEVDGHSTFHLARLHANGSIDDSLTIIEDDLMDDSYDRQVTAVALGSDGKIYVGLGTSVFESGEAPAVIRFNDDGTKDNTFTSPLMDYGNRDRDNLYDETDSRIDVIHELPDGDFLIGGNFGQIGAMTQVSLARMSPNGTIDSDFTPTIEVDTFAWDPAIVRKIHERNDGSLLIAGTFESINGIVRPGIAAINEDGTVVESFNANLYDSYFDYDGTVAIHDFVVDASDDLTLIGSRFRAIGLSGSIESARMDADGNIDSNYTPEMRVPDNIAISPDGVAMIGRFRYITIGSTVPPILMHFDSNAENVTELVIDKPTTPTLLLPRHGTGPIIWGNTVASVNGTPVTSPVALTINGEVDTSFTPQIDDEATINAMFQLADGRIIMAGRFEISEGNHHNLVVLTPEGGFLKSYDIYDYYDITNMELLSSGRFILSGSAYSYPHPAPSEIAMLRRDFADTDNPIDTSFNPPDGLVYKLRDAIETPTGEVFLTDSSSWNSIGISNRGIIKLYADGSLDENFAPYGDLKYASFRDIELDNFGRIYVSGSLQFNDLSRTQLIRITSTGEFDTSFSPQLAEYGYVSHLQMLRDGRLIVAGGFNGDREDLAILDTNQNIDESFNIGSGVNNQISGIQLLAPNILYVHGLFSEIQNQTRNGVARFTLNTPIETQATLLPGNTEQDEGGSFFFELHKTGVGETYQWYKGAAVIEGATDRYLSLAPLTLLDEEVYTVEITNSIETVSRSATLNIGEFSYADWSNNFNLGLEEPFNGDFDNDGWTNGEEYLLRSDPTRTDSFYSTPPRYANRSLNFKFPSYQSRRYTVRYSTDLSEWFTHLQTEGSNQELDVTVPTPDGKDSLFLKVEVDWAP